MIVSSIANLMQEDMSPSCSTAQYKLNFRILEGTHIWYGVWSALVVLISAILLPWGLRRQALHLKVIYQCQSVASKGTLHLHNLNVETQISHGTAAAAQKLLDYKADEQATGSSLINQTTFNIQWHFLQQIMTSVLNSVWTPVAQATFNSKVTVKAWACSSFPI